MTNCCRKCSKMFCKDRGKIENCKDCISYLWLELKKINKIIQEVEDKDYNLNFNKN